MSHTVRNITAGPLALDGGQVLAPGEDAEIEASSDHDTALEDEGKLLRLAPSKQPAAKKKEEGEK